MSSEPTNNPTAGRLIRYKVWPDPEPINDALPPVEAFTLDALPAEIRPWVEDISERMQCPPEFPAVGATVALGTLIGRKVCIRPKREDDWTVVCNHWGMVVGAPAIMKTPSLEQALSPLQRLENVAMGAYDEKRRENAAEEIIKKERTELNRKQVQKALKDGNEDEARDAAARAQASSDVPTVTPARYIVNDPTHEKLGELMQENPNGLLLYRDELIGFLKSLDKDGREDSRAFFLEAWAGANPFTFDRIGRGTIRIEALTLSILGAIQPDALGEYIKGAVAEGSLGSGDGLLQRFQLAVWPDCNSKWVNIDRSPNQVAREQANAVFDRMAALDATAVGAEAAKLPFVRFTPDAQEEFDGWRQKLEIDLRSPIEHPVMQGHLAKYRSLIPSLALIAHLADNQKGGVNKDALAKALSWAKVLESHARRIYSAATRRHQSAATMLVSRLGKGMLGETFSARDLYRKGWVGLAEKEDAEAALQILESHYFLEKKYVQPDPSKLGRPASEMYVVNPKILQNSPKLTDRSDRTDTPNIVSVLSAASA